MASSQYATVAAAAAANTIISGGPAVLSKVVVTTAGAGTATVYDNATTNAGTVLLPIPGAAPVGTVYTIDGMTRLGITVANTGTGPGLTVYFG